jgi:NADPH:quinone reductase-like Zn-dependent oxidoreductase
VEDLMPLSDDVAIDYVGGKTLAESIDAEQASGTVTQVDLPGSELMQVVCGSMAVEMVLAWFVQTARLHPGWNPLVWVCGNLRFFLRAVI